MEDQDMRAYHRFTRVTERFHAQNGGTESITYDMNVVDGRSASFYEDGLYMVVPTDTPDSASSADLELDVTLEGRVRRDMVPFSKILNTKEMVAFARIKRDLDDAVGAVSFEGPIRVVAWGKFSPGNGDERVSMRCRGRP